LKLAVRAPVLLAPAAAALLLFAAPAAAHVTANPREATAGGYTYHAFRVGHGCEGSPTTKVAVQVPEGVVSVKPQETAGWTIAITNGPITPYDNHGETITEGVKEVSWTAATPLPDSHMQQFGLSMKMPDKPGETVYFPVVQTCRQGVHRWITIPVEGQEEPDEPAPGVKLVKAGHDAGHGAAGATDETNSPAADDSGRASDGEVAVQGGEVGSDDDNTLAVIALALGLAGLATGGVSLLRTRSR